MKTVLITGAGRGLGLSLAKECLIRGYTVLAMARRENDELKELVKNNPNKIYYIYGDVTNHASIKKARIQAEKYCESIDVLINNVGIWLDWERLELDHERFDCDMLLEEFDANAVGPVRIVREFLDMVKKSNLKMILNISSEAGSIGMHSWRKGEYAYCMSKAALNMASKIMDFSYSEQGVKVYAVDPGWMKTDMGGPNATSEPSESALDLMNLAEGERKPFIYCNRKGELYEW